MVKLHLDSFGIGNLMDFMIASVRAGCEADAQYLCRAVCSFYENGGVRVHDPEPEILSKLSAWFSREVNSNDIGVDECFSGLISGDGEWGEFFKRGHYEVYGCEYEGELWRAREKYGDVLYRALMRIGMLSYVLYMHLDAEFVFDMSEYLHEGKWYSV